MCTHSMPMSCLAEQYQIFLAQVERNGSLDRPILSTETTALLSHLTNTLRPDHKLQNSLIASSMLTISRWTIVHSL